MLLSRELGNGKQIGNYHINLNVWHLGSGLVLIQSAKSGVSGVQQDSTGCLGFRITHAAHMLLGDVGLQEVITSHPAIVAS